jgi:hypothetical protein
MGLPHLKNPKAPVFSKLVISFFISWVMGYLIIGAWKFDKYLAQYQATKS